MYVNYIYVSINLEGLESGGMIYYFKLLLEDCDIIPTMISQNYDIIVPKPALRYHSFV